MRTLLCLMCLWLPLNSAQAARLPAFLDSEHTHWVAYHPSQLDPRVELHHEQLPTASLEADLTRLREAFDGLILYAWHPMVTPRLLWLAERLGFESVLLGVWQPRSTSELDGVVSLVRQYGDRLNLAIVVGNEGVNFGRYELSDLLFAEDYLRHRLGDSVALTTSEPLVGYQNAALRAFGDFLAPNIHPAIDRTDLAPAEAAAWARAQALELAASTGKTVLVKETGLPRGGREGADAQAQARFWEHYTAAGLQATSSDGVALFNVAFEAFDLPWKAEASGLPFEAWWGLLTNTREPTPAFAVWQSLAGHD